MFNYSIEVWGEQRAIVVTTDTENTEITWEPAQIDPITGETGTWVSTDENSRREVFFDGFVTVSAAEQICHDLRDRIEAREIRTAEQFWRIIQLERAAVLQPFELTEAFQILWDETQDWD